MVHQALEGRLKAAALQLLQPVLDGLHVRTLSGLLGEGRNAERPKQWPSELDLVSTATAFSGASLSELCSSTAHSNT